MDVGHEVAGGEGVLGSAGQQQHDQQDWQHDDQRKNARSKRNRFVGPHRGAIVEPARITFKD